MEQLVDDNTMRVATSSKTFISTKKQEYSTKKQEFLLHLQNELQFHLDEMKHKK